MRKTITTTIADDYGEDHSYELIQHGASEGFDLLPRLLEVFGEPLTEALGGLDLGGSLAGAAGAEEGAAEGAEVEAMMALLDGELDLSSIGRGVSTLARRLTDAGGHKLLLDLLKHTQRDGQPLSNKHAFDRAYQGNYGEMIRAAIWAAKENFGPAIGRLQNPFGRGSR